MSIRVAVVGATGKLGSVAVDLIEAAPDLELVAALGSKSDLADMLGTEAAPSEVVLDVSVPAVSPTIVDYALDAGRNVVVGTSGWSAARLAPLGARLRDLPELGVIVVPNFSLGSALGTAFAATAAKYFDSIEIVEAHAASKIDSPSGTAVRTAELIARARDERGPVVAPHTDQRARGQQVAGVAVHSLRLDGVIAKQSVVLGGQGETLTITHDTTDPRAYAAGILHALRSAPAARGLTVGLDQLLGL
ncbi:4-hydroxy-tetrahydrodipicolinate reductase [Humibacter sp.]|jgi:4-hydroxy-tetrahydrodipicolinate reductase|uniref:4-hydroxy-tetrahydrodipicolinate reductase n=1 Tax=Humibacter sp. TaxID=1940291 RepID=UPI002CE423A2|nr:4-hydroxy-tetrahydrodipicolinate reductase [Humibacter sp.]HVX06344.1 4-hydroxy-tetrahydrodipicolinate reductase [Humibacter sp.]